MPERITERILVAGIGNLFLGDDGFGPEAVRVLAAEGGLPDAVRVTDYGIRGMHLAYDLLEGYRALVLVDALPGGDSPGLVEVLEVTAADLNTGGGVDAHGMDPAAMLASLEQLGGALPLTYVVGCRVESCEDTIGLSAPVAAAVPTATVAIRELVASLCEPSPAGQPAPSAGRR
ncbi:MAG: hydrogenase maturation protease [Cryptosporangiaceae bacterium]|nr:hydrogenase maturation protease [Cryptosporangiaceae bacterium]